jgi:hypothetical protein
VYQQHVLVVAVEVNTITQGDVVLAVLEVAETAVFALQVV